MKKLFGNGAFIWVVLAIFPIAIFIHIIGEFYHICSSVIVRMQLLFLVLQLFSFFINIRYRWKNN